MGITGAIAEPLAAREQGHRRRLLLAAGALIILSTAPVIGHHLSSRADAVIAGRDHVFGFCMIALHELLNPVHLTFHGLLAAGLVYAIADRVRAWSRLRASLSAVTIVFPDPASVIGRAAGSAGLAIERVRIVDALPTPAFTAGWLHPRVYVAAWLPELLDESEVTAVLAHEAAHVARRDPLRMSLWRLLACTLFYIPAFRRLADDLADEAEILADDRAAGDEPLPLASALVRLAEHHALVGPMPMTAGFHHADLFARRVRRLAGEAAGMGTHVTGGAVWAAAAVLMAAWVSGVAVAHPLPLPIATGMTHCLHAGAWAWSHLRCLHAGVAAAGLPCPHMGV